MKEPTGESAPASSGGTSPARPEVRHKSATVAGGQLDYWCDGQGPAVVFLSGLGGDDSLASIARQIADEAYACFYFRPGDGPVGPPDHRLTAGSDAADLHDLLAVAGLPKPVVLVAHSYGGLIADIAAAEHPEEIAGVVFVDASVPGVYERFDAIFTPAQRAHWDVQLQMVPHVDLPTSLVEAAEALPSFPPIPVTVITGTRPLYDDQLPSDKMQAIWLKAQDEFAATLTPDARHVLAETGHYVHVDDPDLVVMEIRALLARTEH